MSKMNKKGTYRDQSTFALSKETLGHVSDCFEVFPSVELLKTTLRHVNLLNQKYANCADKHDN